MGFFSPAPSATLITEAQRSHEAALRSRQKRYSFTMGFRTISFVVAVLLPVPVWAKIALIFGAIILPWTAVTAANAPSKKQKGKAQFGTGSGAAPAPPLHLDGATVIPGDVVPPRESLEGR